LLSSASLALLLLAPAAPAAPAPDSAERFFVGRTESLGTVSMVLSGSHKVRDRTLGRLDSSGALLLDEVVEEEGKPARRRSWRLVRGAGGRISGTISDASGPVSGEVRGNLLHLAYKSVEGGAQVEQWITFDPSGRTASNRMVFRKFGFKVATLEGMVRRSD
jgi:Protein of unknown function (DUF3833)